MATPHSASKMVALLRAEGLGIRETKGWRTHNRNHRGPWGPVHGVMLHHTVTRGDTPLHTANSVTLCRDGYSALPGPLCHGVIDKQGIVHLVGYGRTNHAGLGDDDVLRAVIAERAPFPYRNEANTDGNRHFYGFECINLGNNVDTWPTAQVEAMVRASAALLRGHGWNAESVIGHLEWQPGKIDPLGPGFPGMDGIRTRVAERLKHPASWSPTVASGNTYRVREGDTLYSIARAHKTTVKKLIALNPERLSNPDLIQPGWNLRVKK